MRRPREEKLSGWGRVPCVSALQVLSEELASITTDVPLSRGLGRSYGDASLPAQGDRRVAGSILADRILSFDPASGILRAEAGLSLRELVRLVLTRGFFTPVSPGTQFVTLGGMVAAAIHGKGHHRGGCFGLFVFLLCFCVVVGCIIDCSTTKERDL